MGFRAPPRACAALSPADSSGHLDDNVSATCPSRSLLALDSSCRFSPPASRLLPQAPLGPRAAARRYHGFHYHEPLGAVSASGEYCVSRCGAGAGGGGKREAVLRRLRAPHYRTRSREGRCCPAAAPGPRACPAGRFRTPRPSAPRLRHQPPARNHRCLLPPRARADVLPPRRRQRVRRCLATPPFPRPAAARLPR